MGAGAIAPAPTDMFYTQTIIILARFWPSLGSEIVTENCGGPQIHYETSAKRRLQTADYRLHSAGGVFESLCCYVPGVNSRERCVLCGAARAAG